MYLEGFIVEMPLILFICLIQVNGFHMCSFFNNIKDGAYFFNCACALRISRYSGFLWVVPTDTLYRDIFARFKTMRRKHNLASAFWYPKRKLGVNMYFSEIIIKASIWRKMPYIALCFILNYSCCLIIKLNISLKDAPLPPIFSWIPVVHT